MEILAGMRLRLFSIHEANKLGDPKRRLQLMRDYPFTSLIKILESSPISAEELIANPAIASWSSVFLHKFSMNMYLSHVFLLDQRLQYGSYSEFSTEEVERFLKEEVKQTHPEDSDLLLKWVLSMTQNVTVYD